MTVGYDLSQPQTTLINKLKGICVLISCMNVKKLDLQIPWIEAAKLAGVKRFVPSEWVSPIPRGICDVKDTVGLPEQIAFVQVDRRLTILYRNLKF